MTIDFSNLYNKITNLYNSIKDFTRKIQDIYANPNPMDVNVQTIDDAGNLTTVSIPNIAKWRQMVWNDALSAMKKTYYVDQINGDDNNPGTADAPFKTLKKAIDSVPVGGYGEIYLKEGQVHKITSTIEIENKAIYIRTWNIYYSDDNLQENAWIENVSYVDTNYISGGQTNYTTGIAIRGGRVYFNYVNVRTANLYNPDLGLFIWEGFLRRHDHSNINATFFSSIIEIGDTDLVRIPTGPTNIADLYFYKCKIKRVGPNRNGFVLYNEAGNVSIAQHITTVTLQDGSEGSLSDLIGGQIIRDASTNIPLNFITNFPL